MANQREDSRKNWRSDTSVAHVNSGCFQRIADACELMAMNHANLISDRDQYRSWWQQEKDTRVRLERRIQALRGVITRMKRKESA